MAAFIPDFFGDSGNGWVRPAGWTGHARDYCVFCDSSWLKKHRKILTTAGNQTRVYRATTRHRRHKKWAPT